MADTPLRVKLAVTSGTVGTSAADLIGEDQGRRYLAIKNEHASATIAVALDTATPAVNTAGSWTIAAGASLIFDSGIVPTNAFRIIASGAATPYTVWEV